MDRQAALIQAVIKIHKQLPPLGEVVTPNGLKAYTRILDRKALKKINDAIEEQHE